MTNGQNQSKRGINWPAVGAVATVLAVIIAVLALPHFKPSEYKLSASGDYFIFAVPGFFTQGLNSLERATEPGVIGNVLPLPKDAELANRALIAKAVSEYMKKVFQSVKSADCIN